MAEDKGLYRKKDEQFSYNPKGKNYLFVVGINDYLHFPKLSNAVKDAQDLVEILTTYYHFEKDNIIELFDKEATRGNIVDKFEYLVGKLEKDDNLLIYFSGHGHLNEETNIGYWIPVEANRVADYVPNSSVIDYLQVIKSHHTFVIADAYFSGSFFSDTKRLETERHITEVDKHRSRWALTSGRLEAVSDGQIGKNSPFASYLLKYLREEGKPPFAVYDLVQYVKKATANNAEQTPIGGPLQGVGDEGGEFVFYPRENEKIAWYNATHQKAILLAIAILFLLVLFFFNKIGGGNSETDTNQADTSQVVREDSNIVNQQPATKQPTINQDNIDTAKAKQKQAKLEKNKQDSIAQIAKAKQEVSTTNNQAQTTNNQKKDLPTFEEPEMVYVEGGTFQMGYKEGRDGDDDKFIQKSKPLHEVTVSSFYMGAYEVSQKEWKAVMGKNPSNFNKGDNLPVENVSWNDIQVFLEKLNNMTGKKYRLPTEAEWEYAARQKGQAVMFGNGKDIADPSQMNFFSKKGIEKRSVGYAVPVNSFSPNSLGLYNMSGNICEWCEDLYDEKFYEKSAGAKNPVNKTTGTARVHRGGSWLFRAGDCRVVIRNSHPPSLSNYNLGFRLVIGL